MSLSSAIIDRRREVAPMDSLGRLLVRVGSELDDVAARLGRLTIGGGSGGPEARMSPREVTAFQDIDLAGQLLESIAAVLRRAAQSEAAAGPIDVEALAADLPLEAMTRIVTGRPDHREPGGDLDLF